MTKYFQLLLTLLEIEPIDSYIQIAEIIELNRDKDFQIYHQYHFLFGGYRDFLNGKLSLEEFLKIGDFDSKTIFDLKKIDSISFLKSNPKIEKEKIYIFDSLAKGILPEMANVYYG